MPKPTLLHQVFHIGRRLAPAYSVGLVPDGTPLPVVAAVHMELDNKLHVFAQCARIVTSRRHHSIFFKQTERTGDDQGSVELCNILALRQLQQRAPTPFRKRPPGKQAFCVSPRRPLRTAREPHHRKQNTRQRKNAIPFFTRMKASCFIDFIQFIIV